MSREFSCLSSSHEKIQTKINSNGLVPNNVTCSGIKSHLYGAVKTKYLRSCHDDKNRGVSFSRNFRSPLVCDGQGWQADQPSIPPRVFFESSRFSGKILHLSTQQIEGLKADPGIPRYRNSSLLGRILIFLCHKRLHISCHK